MIYTALIGDPVVQSPSPRLYGAFARTGGLEYAHLKIRVPADGGGLGEALSALLALGFAGVNVTLPYKQAVIQYLNSIEENAARIGAVNVIRITKGRLYGCNTDAVGATRAIEQVLGRRIEAGEKAVLFGTGGAAKAVVAALIERGAAVTVFHRMPISPNTVDFDARFSGHVRLSPSHRDDVEKAIGQAAIVCNATSAGMVPNLESCVLPDGLRLPLAGATPKIFFDTVYKPLNTRFLHETSVAGHIVADGLSMLVHQGVEAFRLWTGAVLSEEAVRAGERIVREEA
jgi:shikimate dehydrogenase